MTWVIVNFAGAYSISSKQTLRYLWAQLMTAVIVLFRSLERKIFIKPNCQSGEIYDNGSYERNLELWHQLYKICFVWQLDGCLIFASCHWLHVKNTATCHIQQTANDGWESSVYNVFVYWWQKHFICVMWDQAWIDTSHQSKWKRLLPMTRSITCYLSILNLLSLLNKIFMQ